jgi:hypothetical protein
MIRLPVRSVFWRAAIGDRPLETILDDLAEKLGLCPFEFRYLNALGKGLVTATGQKLEEKVGLRACLDALRPQWRQMRREAAKFNKTAHHLRRGVGVACGWYGIGNTSVPNASVMRIGCRQSSHRHGRFLRPTPPSAAPQHGLSATRTAVIYRRQRVDPVSRAVETRALDRTTRRPR